MNVLLGALAAGGHVPTTGKPPDGCGGRTTAAITAVTPARLR